MKDGRPFCCGCFETLYAEYCEACGENIGELPLEQLKLFGRDVYSCSWRSTFLQTLQESGSPRAGLDNSVTPV